MHRPALRTPLLVLALAAFPALARALPFWLKLPEGVSSYSDRVDDLFYLILWITGIIFVIVEFLLLFFLFRYRHREGRRALYTHGNNRVEVVWTIVPAVICVVLALLSRRTWADPVTVVCSPNHLLPGWCLVVLRAECWAYCRAWWA